MAVPEPEERLTEDDSGPVRPLGRSVERPDWLVGADEGAAAEQARIGGGSPPPRETPRLIKPGGNLQFEGPEPGAATTPGRPLPAAKQASAPPPETPQRPVAWAAAASSVPRLRLEPAASESLVARKLQRAEEPDAREAAPDLAAPGFPDDVPAPPGPAVAGPSLSALHEPWWIVALEELRSSRRTQILVVGALLVVIAALIFWPRGEPGVSLAAIRRHPQRFDSQVVRVRGEVGEVFSVGGGYAFNLQQGRDTMVVFTRSRVPVPHQNVTVVASVSTGFLDGAARLALFEVPR